jgi:hypothetical protein
MVDVSGDLNRISGNAEVTNLAGCINRLSDRPHKQVAVFGIEDRRKGKKWI